MPIRAHAAFLHISKCAGSSVERALLQVLGEDAQPSVQFDRCYVEGFERNHELSPEAASAVLWDTLALPPAGDHAVGHHWSLPTLLRCFAAGDVSTVLREPAARILSYVEFARSMSQASHRHWYPDYLPAWIARTPFVDLLAAPEASRALDNLITRQVLWGNRRIPQGRFIRDADVELLAEAAIDALEQLGFVGVVERPDAMAAGLSEWLGAVVEVPYANRTRVRDVPGLFRSESELPLVRELLHERSKVDALVWRHFAGDIDVVIDQRLDELSERSLAAKYRYRTLPVGPESPSRLEVHVHHDGAVERVDPSALLAVVSECTQEPVVPAGTHLSVYTNTPSELDIAAAFAGHDLTRVVVGPEITRVEQIDQVFHGIQRAMAGSGELVLRLGTLRRAVSPEEVVTVAINSGFALVDIQVHERPAGWTLRLVPFGAEFDPIPVVTLPPMSTNWRRYDWPIEMDNDGDSRAVVLRLLGDAVDVLELGSSAGRMTRIMRERGLNVTAIEIDSDAAAEAELSATVMHVLDLEAPDALAPLDGQQFDLILAADVFEHLRDPAACLAQVVPLLREAGRLIVSIPNIAHADLRLALLEGRFEYTDIGLLDHTHLSFFTRDRLASFLADGGLTAVEWHRIHRDIGATETSLRPELVEWGKLVLADDPEATTYQWIVECTRNTDTTSSGLVETQPAVDPLEQRIRAAAATWEPSTPTTTATASTPPRSPWAEFIARVRGRSQ